jgi:hypothetical protein
MNRSVADVPRSAPAWPAMPSVWWPWACQLLAVDTTTQSVDLDFVALRPGRVRGAVVEAGTLFTVRAIAATEWPTGDLAAVTGWSATATTVTLLAGHHRRSSWACVSAGHRRILLADVTSKLGVNAPTERAVTAASPRELERARTTHLFTQE